MSYQIRPEDHDHYAILTDTTLCTGCETCIHACKETYGLGRDRAWRWKMKVDDLSSTRFTTIISRPGNHHVRQQCRHCIEPACVSACLVGALQKTDIGPVIYDEKRCMGCRYCMMACPYGIPRYKWESPVPYVRKCIMCHDRIKEGKQPACTEACPYGATIFGTRAEMCEAAMARFAANPGKYYQKPGQSQPELYGWNEVGGTSVLYISDISLDFLGWQPNLGDAPIPALTWGALSKVPPISIGVAAAMSGIYWVIGRRMKLQAEAAEAASQETPES
ncbi:MAG: 4Fe-4S dicluster domain-containing protein [Planctomycetota bacterium]